MKKNKKVIISIDVVFCNGRYHVIFNRDFLTKGGGLSKRSKIKQREYTFSGNNNFMATIFYKLANSVDGMTYSRSHFRTFPTTTIYTHYKYDEKRYELMHPK